MTSASIHRIFFHNQPPLAADASLFVGDDEGVDEDATAEVFFLVAGLSTISFGLAFNVPFIVAPSVLYSARESGYVCIVVVFFRDSNSSCEISLLAVYRSQDLLSPAVQCYTCGN